MQRLQYALQLSCVPEEAICQNTHRTGALGKGLIKPSGNLWDLTPVSGSASVTANHYTEVKFSLDKDLSWPQRQISSNVFAHTLGTQLQNPYRAGYQGLRSQKGMLRDGLHFGNASRNPNPWSKQMQQTGPAHTQRRESRAGATAPTSPEITVQTAGERWTESPARSLAAPQESGRPCGFQGHWSQSCQSHGKPWDESLRVSSTVPSPAACQKCSDPEGSPFHGKCWNLGFIPIWNETRFCNIEILHKMKWLFTAQLYWLMQTACNWEEPPKRVFQSEFPGLSLPRTQLTAKLTSAVLQEGSEKTNRAQHQQNIIRRGGRCCWSDTFSGEVTLARCTFPSCAPGLAKLQGRSLPRCSWPHAHVPASLGSEVFRLQPVTL